MRLSLFISSLLLMTLMACLTIGLGEEPIPVPTIKSPSLVPQEVPITTLLRNPNSFEGQTIWVTGQYRSLPLLVCGDTTHRSPATWTLVFGDVEAFASGFDEALRPLAASGLSLTVEGRWQKWSGPVGCGRRAPTEEIWYLAAARIVSPNPLVKSDEDGEVVVVVPSPTAEIETPDSLPVFTLTPEEPGEETAEPEPSPNTIPTPTFQSIPTSAPSPTVTSQPSATSGTGNGGDDGEDGTNTSTPTPSATPTPGDGTTASETATATATTAGTAGPTATPAAQGELEFGSTNNNIDIAKRTLAANTPHSWTFTPPVNEPIVITAGSVLTLNIKLTLIAPNGTVVAEANQTGVGMPEIINFTAPNPTGEYNVVVSGENGTSGDYLLLLLDDDHPPLITIRDTLNYSSIGSGSTLEDEDHFWNFSGQEGDVITIEVSPTGNTGNLIFYIVGPDGTELRFIDETGSGSSESLTYTLPATGFYSIGIGESNFEPVDYSMTLTQ